jgi:hypothetical protein
MECETTHLLNAIEPEKGFVFHALVDGGALHD